MGLRFRRSLRLAPGLRLNLGLRGASLSVGPRGASLNLGQRGLYGNLGVPGTGISVRERLTAPPPLPDEPGTIRLRLQLSLDEVGRLVMRNEDGSPLTPRTERAARREGEAQLRAWLEGEAERINAGANRILALHLVTPVPQQQFIYDAEPFVESAPTPPGLLRIGLLDRLMPWVRERKTSAHAADEALYALTRLKWTERKAAHDATQKRLKERWEVGRRSDPTVMEELMLERLAYVAWARETLVSLSLEREGKDLHLDVDLPEVEDMPEQTATLAARGLKLNIRDRTEGQRRKMYALHIHAVLFRVIGEAFATLPELELVVCSGFSQRTDPATGEEREEYLLSVAVPRAVWEGLDFSNLAQIDPPRALERFELRRAMTAGGIFTAVEPIEVPQDRRPAVGVESPAHE